MKHIANVDVVCASASELVRKEIGKKSNSAVGCYDSSLCFDGKGYEASFG